MDVYEIEGCPICRNTSSEDHDVGDFFACKCGSQFKPKYRVETIKTHSGDWADSREEVRDRFLESARFKLSQFNDNLSIGDKILEIGCGTGEFLREAKRAGYKPTGVDANDDVVEYLRTQFHDIDVHHGQLQEVDLPAESFDGVMMSHLFEHIPEPRKFLSELNRLLTPRAVGYIGTPNVAAHSRYGFRSQFGGLNVADHKILYTPNTLRELLESEGFEVKRIWTSISGFDIPRAFRSWLIERLGIDTRQDLTSGDEKSGDSARSGRVTAWKALKTLDLLYTKSTYRAAPLFELLFAPYFAYIKRKGTAPMLNCVFRK